MAKDSILFLKRILIGSIILLILIAEFVATLHFPYICSGLRIRSYNESFVVSFVSPHGPAAACGFQKGDEFYSMKGITRDYRATLTTVEQVERLYSSVYEFDTPIEYVTADGDVKVLLIPSGMSFFTRLLCLETDDVVLFVTGLLFAIFAIICSRYLKYMQDAGAFVALMYGISLVLVNGFTNTSNPYWFSVFNEIFYQVCAAGIASSSLLCVCYFLKMTRVNDSVIRMHRFIAMTPLCYLIFRLAMLPFDPVSVFDSILTTLTKGLMYISILWLIVAFFWLLRHIPRQSSSMLRCLIVATAFGVLPLLALQIDNMFSSSYWIAENEIPMEVLPLLFVPVAISFSFILTKSYTFDRIASRGMVLGCSIITSMVVLMQLAAVGVPIRQLPWLMLIISPIVYIFLDKPVTTFLFPQVENMEQILSHLESEVYMASDINDICCKTTIWLQQIMAPSFIYYFALKATDTSYELLYSSEGTNPSRNAKLEAMIEERKNSPEKVRSIQKHGSYGISIPLFRGNELYGYLYLGDKKVSDDSRVQEFFSTAEIRLSRTIARIMMEAVMMNDIMQNQKRSRELEVSNDRLAHDVARKNMEIMRIQDMTVLGMAAMVESRDNSTGGHIKRTSAAVNVFMERLLESGQYDIDADWANMVVRAAPMHDLGKIAVDDRILRKEGPFTQEEYQEMKKHSAEGARVVHTILENVEDLQFKEIAVNIAHYHHEKWNGTGYPAGLKGEEIPLEARIMAFADVFDALVSKRCYKEAFSFEKAYEIISNDLGSHFDPELGKLFLDCFPDLEILYLSEFAD